MRRIRIAAVRHGAGGCRCQRLRRHNLRAVVWHQCLAALFGRLLALRTACLQLHLCLFALLFETRLTGLTLLQKSVETFAHHLPVVFVGR